MLVKKLKRILVALKWAHLGPKGAPNEVLGHIYVSHTHAHTHGIGIFAYFDNAL